MPLLFDEKLQKIVTTESADIIKLFGGAFDAFAKKPDVDLAPKGLASAMEEMDAIVYPGINDGVYRCGFARSQEAYDFAYEAHWKAMDLIEERLGRSRYLCGDVLTLSDVRLFTTLVRYDVVYYSHFKTSRNRLRDMPNLHRFAKDVYALPGVAETCDIAAIKGHYFGSHPMLNPSGVVPKGPEFDLAG